MKTFVYVDGFNVYYGCLKRSPYKWLNLAALMKQVLPANLTVARIKYFTAHVSGASDPDSPKRQDAYIRALKTLPEIEVYWGSFLAKNIWRPIINLPVGGAPIHAPPAPITLPAGAHAVALAGATPQVVVVGNYPPRGSKRKKKVSRPVRDALRCEVHTMEEKGSDVNLAAHLLNDAWKAEFEVAVVVSNDTDLLTPIQMVKEERGKPVVVVCPDIKRAASSKLVGVASSVRRIRPAMLAASQFPAVMGTIRKPAGW